MRVKVMNPFSCSIPDRVTPNGTMTMHFSAGQIVNDPYTAQALVDLKCPVIAEDDLTTTVCPRCRTVCDTEKNCKRLTIVQTNVGFNLNYDFFSFERGDVVEHEWLLEKLREYNIPLDGDVDGVECPKCHHLFY